MSYYTPRVGGFAQDTYVDQIGTALSGQLANASDYNFVDSAVVGDDVSFAVAGSLYGLVHDSASIRAGINSSEIVPLASGTEYCIVVRNQQAMTDADGNVGWETGRMANVLRFNRVGGLFWAKAYDTSACEAGDTVRVVSAVTSATIPVGTLTTASSITGATLTVVPNLQVIGNHTVDSNGYCIAEFEVVINNNASAVSALETAVGMPYTDEDSLSTRVTTLEG